MSQGTEFALPDPSYEQYSWILQDEHNPASHAPLIASVGPTGAVVHTDGLPTAITINGYNYARQVANAPGAPSPFGTMPAPEKVEDLTGWRQEWPPEIDKVSHMLENFEPGTVPSGDWAEVLDSQDQEYRRVFGGVHRTAVGPARTAATRFTEEYVKRFGEDRHHDAMALLLGLPHLSLERAAALWDLSRMVRADESLQTLVDSGPPPPDTTAAKAFRDSFADMLEKFGYTTNNGLQDLANWRDGSPVPLAMIRAYSTQDDSKSPVGMSAKQANRRSELEAELRDSPSDDTDTSDLALLLEMAQQLIPNLEDHNLLCDQRLVSASRARWLVIGSHLQKQGFLSVADDVFFYQRSELIQAMEEGIGIPREEVSRRRALQDQFRSTLPPLYLGLKPETLTSPDDIPAEGAAQQSVKGMAASPGVYRGRARVIQSLDQAGTLKNGDILVARALTPPWTPFFGIVGAIVTNSGGVISHGAVVAREFGIPAVVGTGNGTDIIRDGSIVTVDGTAGEVFIELQ